MEPYLMYEVNQHLEGEELTHYTVDPIKVIRHGVLPGCSGVTITAIGHDGRRFQGSPGNYYETEAAAWVAIRDELMVAIGECQQEAIELSERAERLFVILQTVQDK